MGMNIVSQNKPNTNNIIYSLNNIEESFTLLDEKFSLENSFKDSFQTNYSLGNYCFDFYFDELKLGVQIDALSYSYSNIYNKDASKLLSIPHKKIQVLKVSDYQILVDSDEIVRFIKNFKSKANFN